MVRHRPEGAFSADQSRPPPTASTNVKYLVFAGNYRQFSLWAEDKSIPPEEALFVDSPANLLNRYGEHFTLVKVGTFHLRPDAEEIMEEARVRFPHSKWEHYPIS